MMFSTKAEYGVRVMVELARRSGDEPIPLADILEIHQPGEEAGGEVRGRIRPERLEVPDDVIRGEGLPVVPRDTVAKLERLLFYEKMKQRPWEGY